MKFYTREQAAKKIKEIKENSEPIKTGQTLPIRKGEKFDTYKIDLEYLVPNIRNDRIASEIREFNASSSRELTHENPNDVEYVYDLIEKSSPNENERTIKDLLDKGQQVDGIVTQDGVIIDGNRRATLLRKLFNGEYNEKKYNVNDFRFFNAIILSENISENEILALETQIQIGEDSKVGYKPTNMYLKVENLSNAGYNDKQISNFMAIKTTEVKERKEILATMKENLNHIDKDNYYTLTHGLEDQFKRTNSVFKKMDNGTYNTEWDPTDEDITNFKSVCYDYLRSKFEGKKYRDVLIGNPNNSNGVFISENIWKDFYKHHENIVEKNNPQNENDWISLSRPGKQFHQNLDNANRGLFETLQEKTISNIVATIEQKTLKLKELLMKREELNEDDYRKLRKCNSEIWNMIKDIKDFK